MQLSIETTTQSTSILQASISGYGSPSPLKQAQDDAAPNVSPVSVLETATKKAEEDAVVIATLQQAIEKSRGETDDDSEKTALATIEDYQKTAGKLQTALGDGEIRASTQDQLLSFESATISTTTIEAEVDGNTLSAEFVSFERVSYDSATGLTARSAEASNIQTQIGNVSGSYQSASVSELYVGTGDQVGNLLAGFA